MSEDPFSPDFNGSNPDHSMPAADGQGTTAKKRRVWLWVLGIFFGGGFLCLLICCGVGAYLVQNHGSVLFEPTRQELNQLAGIREEVGEIESLNIDFSDTIDEAESNPDFMILKGQAESGPVKLSVKMSNNAKLEKVFLVRPDDSRESIDLERNVGDSTISPTPEKTAPAEATPISARQFPVVFASLKPPANVYNAFGAMAFLSN